MKKIVAIAFMLAFAAEAHAAPDQPSEMAPSTAMPNPVLLSLDDIRSVRGRAKEFNSLLNRCTKELVYSPTPVEVYAPDAHYTAAGLNPSENDGKQLANDAQAAYREGLCYVVTGEKRFAVAAHRIIDAWANTLKSVDTAQGKANINFNMTYMIAAANWTYGVNEWNSAAFDRFLRTVALPNSASENPNNHGMWAMLMEASAATHLNDPALLAKARARWIEIMEGATAPDGTLVREIERSGTSNWRDGPDKGSKGLAYTHYFLLPASMAAKIFADQGQPVWKSEGGVLLGAAFDKAAGWTLHPETFPFYESNGGKLEGVKTAAYFPLLLRYYHNKDAEAVMQQGDVGTGGFLLPKLFSSKR